MDNQITVNNQGKQDVGSLVSYFNLIAKGKNILFYTKNEPGPDNTIKMYLCEESNPQIMSNGIQNDYENIKQIMARIIKSEDISDIKYLTYKSLININSEKHIGLNSQNIDKLKASYNMSVGTIENNNVSPADILNQTFGGNNDNVSQNVLNPDIQPSVNIGVNDVPNKFDMEQTSVNLNPIPSISQVSNVMPDIQPIISDSPQMNIDIKPEEMQVKPVENSKIDSPYNVNNSVNMFDSPINSVITNEDVNQSHNNIEENVVPFVQNNIDNSISSDLISAEVALNNKEINLYEERINFLEAKNKYLINQMTNKQDNNELTNTASTLFDNNEIDLKTLNNVPDLNKAA